MTSPIGEEFGGPMMGYPPQPDQDEGGGCSPGQRCPYPGIGYAWTGYASGVMPLAVSRRRTFLLS